MTAAEIAAMSNLELRNALLEAAGWKRMPDPPVQHTQSWKDPNGRTHTPNDSQTMGFKFMYNLEMALSKKDLAAYDAALIAQTGRKTGKHGAIHADARARGEAYVFMRTNPAKAPADTDTTPSSDVKDSPAASSEDMS